MFDCFGVLSGGKWSFFRETDSFRVISRFAPIGTKRRNLTVLVFFIGRSPEMCQEAPGPRCWSDTCKTRKSLQSRLDKAEAALSDTRKKMDAASLKQDYAAYEKLRGEETARVAAVKVVKAEMSLNQRDMDGTRTGRRKLEEALANASSDREAQEIQTRIRTGESLRFSRMHALEISRAKRENSAHRPLLRIAA